MKNLSIPYLLAKVEGDVKAFNNANNGLTAKIIAEEGFAMDHFRDCYHKDVLDPVFHDILYDDKKPYVPILIERKDKEFIYVSFEEVKGKFEYHLVLFNDAHYSNDLLTLANILEEGIEALCGPDPSTLFKRLDTLLLNADNLTQDEREEIMEKVFDRRNTPGHVLTQKQQMYYRKLEEVRTNYTSQVDDYDDNADLLEAVIAFKNKIKSDLDKWAKAAIDWNNAKG